MDEEEPVSELQQVPLLLDVIEDDLGIDPDDLFFADGNEEAPAHHPDQDLVDEKMDVEHASDQASEPQPLPRVHQRVLELIMVCC